jgi:signal transduction histidine kinase
VLGTINLNRTDTAFAAFEDADLDTMLVLAGQAAICIENSRLHAANVAHERLAAVGQTVAGISHCIKNILTGVRGGLSLVDMSSQREDWTLHGQGFEILKRNIDRLASIVLDMLDYSKDREPCKGTVSVTSLFDEVIGTVRSAADLHQVRLERACAEDATIIQVDGQQIYRCILNLVHNAIDASPTGGAVMLSAERVTGEQACKLLKDHDATEAIVLRVADNGPGVDEEHLPVIFEPFFSTKGSKGTGLGLAVTRKIVEEHGGSIRVESKPGEPAVFAIYLPA